VTNPSNKLFCNAQLPTVSTTRGFKCTFNQKYGFDFDITVPDIFDMLSKNKLRRNGKMILD